MILIQLTDLHVTAQGQAAMRVCETNQMTERALRAVRAFRPRPDAVLITGDLADNGLAAEYRNLAAIVRRTAEVPVYVIPGNHDRREVVRTELAHLPGVTADPVFVQYAIEDLPLRVVMLDTVVPGHGHGELCADRLAWLDATLAAAPDRPTLIGMHHPPILCGIGHMDAIALRDIHAFTAVIARHRQVRRIVAGHHHRPITASVAHAPATVAPSVAHQSELDLNAGAAGLWNLEPPAFHVHVWLAQAGQGGAIASHTAYVEAYPGPYPFLVTDDYPGMRP